MNMKAINLNNEVLVNLTDFGKKQLKDAGYGGDYSLQPDGTYKFQLWELMKIFGEHLRMGFHVPFEKNIFILIEQEPFL